MNISFLIVSALLIFSCLLAISGLFLSKNYDKKILALASCYSNFLFLIIVLSLGNMKIAEVFVIITGVIIIFAANLLTFFAISKNIVDEEKRIKD